MSERPTVIWRFATAGGSVRLLLEVDEDKAGDLHGELAGCAIVADDLSEFMALASRAIDRAGGILGELMKAPWPSAPLKATLRAAMARPTTVEAAEAVIAAGTASTPSEAELLLSSADWQVERDFIYGVLYGLDELAEQALARIAFAFGVTAERLAAVLGIELI